MEPLVDILGCISVKHKMRNNPECEMQKAVDRQGHSKRPSMTLAPERRGECEMHLNSRRHM